MPVAKRELSVHKCALKIAVDSAKRVFSVPRPLPVQRERPVLNGRLVQHLNARPLLHAASAPTY